MFRKLAGLMLIGVCGVAFAQTSLKVKMFPGAQALPAIAAASQGIFERHGLAAGEFQIAQAAVDNAVAMVELAGKDVVIVTGGDSSMNELFVQPDIRSYADLKGHTVL